jgi:hypothetical protein
VLAAVAEVAAAIAEVAALEAEVSAAFLEPKAEAALEPAAVADPAAATFDASAAAACKTELAAAFTAVVTAPESSEGRIEKNLAVAAVSALTTRVPAGQLIGIVLSCPRRTVSTDPVLLCAKMISGDSSPSCRISATSPDAKLMSAAASGPMSI